MPAKYKKRADGRYLTQIQVGIQENGKPKFKNIYAKTIRELEEKASVFRQEMEHGIVLEDGSPILADWAVKWLEAYKSGKEYNTIRMYHSAIYSHIIPSLGHYKLKNLKPHHVQEMINKKASEGLTRTLSIIKLTLSQILEQAVANGYVHQNVCDRIDLPKIDKSKKRSLIDGEKELIYSAKMDLKSKAFLYTLLLAGLRREEILALTKNDIDLSKKTISVNKALIFKHNQGEIKPSPKSDAGNRTIPMPTVLTEILTEYLPTVEGFHIFPSAKNEVMSETAFRRFWGEDY